MGLKNRAIITISLNNVYVVVGKEGLQARIALANYGSDTVDIEALQSAKSPKGGFRNVDLGRKASESGKLTTG